MSELINSYNSSLFPQFCVKIPCFLGNKYRFIGKKSFLQWVGNAMSKSGVCEFYICCTENCSLSQVALMHSATRSLQACCSSFSVPLISTYIKVSLHRYYEIHRYKSEYLICQMIELSITAMWHIMWTETNMLILRLNSEICFHFKI